MNDVQTTATGEQADETRADHPLVESGPKRLVLSLSWTRSYSSRSFT